MATLLSRIKLWANIRTAGRISDFMNLLGSTSLTRHMLCLKSASQLILPEAKDQ